MDILKQISAMVEVGKTDKDANYPRDLKGQPGVRELVLEALSSGIKPLKVLDEGLTPGMQSLGRKFSTGEVFVPEILLAMKALNAGVDELRPHLSARAQRAKGKLVLGTVKGDVHDIGKNLARMLLETSGWKVVDLGVDVSPEAFVEAVRREKPVAVGMSALLTTTMMHMQETVKALRKARFKVPVIIGGAPVNDSYAKSIGAIYARDPQAAIEILEAMKAA